MEPMTSEEIAHVLRLIADSSACEDNHMLQSVLLIASSHIDELAKAKVEAESLATSIWEQYYKEDSPDWGLCDSVAGVITQIDNMVSGMEKSKRCG